MTAFAKAASRVRQMGYSPVPLRPENGHPYVKRLAPLATSPLTLAGIAWFATNMPDLQLGVMCGFNGLVAVDIDIDDPEIIEAVCAALPPIMVARRGSKGLCAFFRDPTGKLRSRNFSTLGVGLQKGNLIVEIITNRVVTIPPSMHRSKKGVIYGYTSKLQLDYTPALQLPAITEEHYAAVEQALLPWCPLKPVWTPPERSPEAPQVSDRRMRAYAEKTLVTLAKALSDLKEDRNYRLNTTAFQLGKFVQNGVMAWAEVEPVLLHCCRINGYMAKAGVTTCRKTIGSGLKAGLRNPLPVLADRPRQRFTGPNRPQPEMRT